MTSLWLLRRTKRIFLLRNANSSSGLYGPGTSPELCAFWQNDLSSISLSPDISRSVDIVVIGGGILGATTTYWLARAGMSVMLVERYIPAYGATGRNGGFVATGTAEPYPDAIARLGHAAARAVAQVTYENLALARQLVAEEAIDCHYREPGHLSLAVGEAQYKASAQCVSTLQMDGFPAQLLDRQQAQELVMTPLSNEVTGGLFIPDSGLLHPAKLVYGLLQAAVAHGAILGEAAITQLIEQGDSIVLRTAGADIHTGAAVVATNAWTNTLIPMIRNVIVPVRGQALSYAPTSHVVFTPGMFASLTPTGEYWQQTLDGSIVIGGCRTVALDQDRHIETMQPTAEVQVAIEQILPRLFPELQELSVSQRWAGLMAFTPDYIPVADRIPGIKHGWFAGGFCGHGMPFCLRFGQLLAEAVTRDALPDVLTPFRLDRPSLHL